MNLRQILLGIFTLSTLAIVDGAFAATEVKMINPSGEPALTAEQSAQAVKELRAKKLGLPIQGFDVSRMRGSFYETHGGVMHGAADLLAPRNTPVLAVENGMIAKLFTSKRGGLTV